MQHSELVESYTPDSELEPPRQVGPYELITRLAKGGMAEVYAARHTGDGGLGRVYAVKMMLEHLVEDYEFIDMFHDEARVASQLRHHNIVSVFDQGTYGENGRYLAMDYIEGPTFAQLLKFSPDDRPVGVILSVLMDVLTGLHAAHTAIGHDGRHLRVIHRDVSPANILVDLHGLSRISDFGIAKATERRTVTQPGVYKGRFSYSAPERFKSPDAIDHRVDIFAVGAIMWEALTGERLFRGKNEAETIWRVTSMDLRPPSAGRLAPPAFLDEVCMKALARDPADRYGSAREMLRDMRRVAAINGIEVGSDEVSSWIPREVRNELLDRRNMIYGLAPEQVETHLFDRNQVAAVLRDGLRPQPENESLSPDPSEISDPGSSHTRAAVKVDCTRPINLMRRRAVTTDVISERRSRRWVWLSVWWLLVILTAVFGPVPHAGESFEGVEASPRTLPATMGLRGQGDAVRGA